ncbi:hypothetical protein Baya_9036 [Bagarius yarrelli]|uniref:Uncharacterized protein n=1 Tax=Bagarius yarrelli TaxID=175774 RepID=A0A556U783_BAGYA|nr:hypothetical protein Baya_9036 [Bagarius yarrelli]
MGDGSVVQKENKVETKETDGPADTAGDSDLRQGETENQAATPSESNNSAQLVDEHKTSEEKDKSLPSIPSGEQSDMPHLSQEEADQTESNLDPKTNGENGFLGSAAEDTIAHVETPVQVDVAKEEESSQEDTNSSDKTCGKDGKILNQDGKCGTENTVAESGEFKAAIDSTDGTNHEKKDSIVVVGARIELETGVFFAVLTIKGPFLSLQLNKMSKKRSP